MAAVSETRGGAAGGTDSSTAEAVAGLDSSDLADSTLAMAGSTDATGDWFRVAVLSGGGAMVP